MKQYTYMWEYFVRDDSIAEFERAYGPSGDWVRLFLNGKGYIRTELYNDLKNPQRYVTVDYWESEERYKDFHKTFAAELKSLDDRCEQLTTRETEIGIFTLVD